VGVAGSAALVATLPGPELVDELRLMVFPTMLGRRQAPLRERDDRLKLKLAETRTVGSDGV
jgi:dihydrofolate reductase